MTADIKANKFWVFPSSKTSSDTEGIFLRDILNKCGCGVGFCLR